MGDLRDFAAYVQGRLAVVGAIKARLLDLQSRYETFYQEVCRVREHELSQLAWEIYRRKGALPGGLDAALETARRQAEAELDSRLAEMRKTHDDLLARAEELRRRSHGMEAEAHARNVDLDAQEEALKARNEQLLHAIATYNERIRDMGSGFGFLFNLLRMRELQRERRRLDEEYADVSARIESLRARWVAREKEHAKAQERLRGEWNDLVTRAAAVQAKIDHLVLTRSSLVVRTALERVLFDRYPAKPPGGAEVACNRCGGGNARSNRFCQYCAQRLQADRPDLEGSLEELSELNHHVKRFAEGMKACQELIATVTGLESGLRAFLKSVNSMIDNESRYPLAKLRIDVPGRCVEYGRSFEGLQASVEQRAAHPAELARMAAQAAAPFGPENLQWYFETMGQELSRQAKAQWG